MIFNEPKWKSYIVTSTMPVFSQEECEDIIKVGNSLPAEEATIAQGRHKRKDFKKRRGNIAWFPFESMPQMYQKLLFWANRINNNFFGFDDIQIGEMAQFTRYSSRDHYDWHTDSTFNMKEEPTVRKISMITLLNDPKDYTGGELQIMNQKQLFSLKQGYAIFFASFVAHRLLPVKKGIRISMPIWFGGPPLR